MHTLKRLSMLLVVVVLLAGCGALSGTGPGGGGGDTAGGSASGAPSAGGGDGQQVALALPTGKTSFANCDIGVATDQGFFADEGLSVSTQNLSSGLKVVQALLSGDIDIGGASIEPVINAAAQGQSLKIIGTYADRLTVQMMVPEDIQGVGDLQGKILGIQDVGAFREVMTRMVLESEGMTTDDVQYRGVETTGYIPALVAGQIQSAILHAEQVESIKSEDDSFHSISDLYEVEPDYFYGTYFADESWLGENADVAQGFADALLKAHRFMYDNRDETVRICSEVTGFEEPVVDAAWSTYFEDNCVFPVDSGLETDRISYTIDRMGELDTLAGEQKPDPADLVDATFMDNAVKDAGEQGDRGC